MSESRITLFADGATEYSIVRDATPTTVGAFAATELQRYLAACSGVVIPIARGKQSPKAIHLRQAAARDTLQGEEFLITPDGDDVILSGAGTRSTLYSVYTFLEEYLGIRWPHLGEEVVPRRESLRITVTERKYAPSFAMRGLSGAGRNLEITLQMIDWMPKNRLNTLMFCDLAYWQKHRRALLPEIEKRGLSITLGGHQIAAFISRDECFEKHPEWFALRNGEHLKQGQLCFANPDARAMLVAGIVACLEKQPAAVNRFSLWPEDNLFCCQCDECRRAGFMPLYIRTIQELRAALAGQNLDIAVEHLAYNASLSWDMLQPHAAGAEAKQVDTMLAYWGRNYAHPIHRSPVEEDQRAAKIILAWQELCRKSDTHLTLVEYYTDFWMLTNIFPILNHTIAADLAFYHHAGLRRILSLVVPGKTQPGADAGYPWSWRMGFNLYCFARLCWDVTCDIESLRRDYLETCYGAAAEPVGKYLAAIEELLPALSGFNIPLFRLRLPDIWQQDVTPEEGGTFFTPKEWEPTDELSDTDEKRIETCRRLARALAVVHENVSLDPAAYPEPYRDRIEKARAYFDYVKDRLASLDTQLRAQDLIRRGKQHEAKTCLEAALAFEAKCFSEDTEHCRQWLARIAAASPGKKPGFRQ